MPLLKNKYFPYLLLLLFSIPLFFINVHDVHSWGDDFAQYIKEALNIAHGKPFYQSGYIYNPYNTDYAPAQYPPGYPLLLAPVVKVWGIAIRPMLYMNTVIAVCLLLALFAYFRKHARTVTAICLALAITYSGVMLDLKGNILSDTACLLFVTLYLTARNARSFPLWRIALLIFLLVMAVLIRSQAILLVAAEVLFYFTSILKTTVQKKQLSLKELYKSPSLYIIGGSLALNFVLNRFIFNAPISTASFYDHFIKQTIHGNLKDIAEANISLLLTNLSAFFYYDAHSGFSKAGITFVQNMAMVFVVIGFIISITQRLSVDDFFFLLMCLLVVFLPVHDQRYFLPAIPLLFFYCFITFKAVLPAIAKVDGKVVGAIVTMLYLSTGLGYMKRIAKDPAPGCMPQPRDVAAFKYLSEHVNDHDIIVFTKPRLLTLFTNKRAINTAWQIPMEQDKKLFDSLQVKYILVVDGLDDGYYKDYLHNVQHPADSVRIADGYTLYSLR
jgi:hypothetical protein